MRIDPVYRPSDDGTILVYQGDLLLSQGSVQRTSTGNLELRLSPRPTLSAHVAGGDELLASAVQGENLAVAVPAEASLRPPTTSVLPVEPDDAFVWADFPIPINELVAGNARLAERLILHISGPLTTRLPLSQAESGPQGQVPVRLGSWDLRLAATGASRAGKTSPSWSKPSHMSIRSMRRWLDGCAGRSSCFSVSSPARRSALAQSWAWTPPERSCGRIETPLGLRRDDQPGAGALGSW